MKTLKILPLLLACLIFVGCTTQKPTLEKIAFRADVTHDGNKDRIITSIDNADKGEAYVKVYTTDSQNRDVLLWKDIAGTKEKDYKGIYICKKSGNFDLLVWKPTFDGDTTTLEYAVFYLKYNEDTERTESVNELHESITFTKEQVTKDGDKYEEASEFVATLNKYLEKSAALLDTVGGEVMYSPSVEEKVTNLYYPKWFDKDYKATTNPANTASDAQQGSPIE